MAPELGLHDDEYLRCIAKSNDPLGQGDIEKRNRRGQFDKSQLMEFQVLVRRSDLLRQEQRENQGEQRQA
jgi:hypothetical protein